MNLKESKKNQVKWDGHFLGVCTELAKWSTCLSRQIGAILVRDRVIISTGFNGPPRGIPHCGAARIKSDMALFHQLTNTPEPVYGDNSICPRQRLGYKSGDGLDLCPAAHAEDNCITNAARIGVSTMGASIYMSCGIPCKDCLKKIINAGIIEIVCTSMDVYDDMSKWLVKESEIRVRIYFKEDS